MTTQISESTARSARAGPVSARSDGTAAVMSSSFSQGLQDDFLSMYLSLAEVSQSILRHGFSIKPRLSNSRADSVLRLDPALLRQISVRAISQQPHALLNVTNLAARHCLLLF